MRLKSGYRWSGGDGELTTRDGVGEAAETGLGRSKWHTQVFAFFFSYGHKDLEAE